MRFLFNLVIRFLSLVHMSFAVINRLTQSNSSININQFFESYINHISRKVKTKAENFKFHINLLK